MPPISVERMDEMSAPIRKTILFSLLATFAIGISIWMFSGRASSETGSKNATLPPEVPVAEVLVRKVAPSLEYTGYIAAVESVEVRPRIGGYIQAVTVQSDAPLTATVFACGSATTSVPGRRVSIAFLIVPAQ